MVGQYPGLIFGIGFVVSDVIALHRFTKGHKKARRSIKHWWKGAAYDTIIADMRVEK
jgi:hypothetical protein